jgi:hypothetical protein
MNNPMIDLPEPVPQPVSEDEPVKRVATLS